MSCGFATILFRFFEVTIIQESKAIHRLCGEKGAYDSKRADKYPIIFLRNQEDTGRIKHTSEKHRISQRRLLITDVAAAGKRDPQERKN